MENDVLELEKTRVSPQPARKVGGSGPMFLKDFGHTDEQIGRRLEVLRNEKGLSRLELGEMVGVSYKQIRNYEKGRNKIPASWLFHFAGVLDVDVEGFFEGIPPSDFSPAKKEVETYMEQHAGSNRRGKIDPDDVDTLVENFMRIKKPEERRTFLRLVKAIVRDGGY